MPRKPHGEGEDFRSYMGCEIPKAFFLRFQAMAQIRGLDNKIILGIAVEEEILRWEKKLDKRTAMAYDSLLDIKAYQHDFSVNQLKKPLRVVVNSRGKKVIYPPKKITIPNVPDPDLSHLTETLDTEKREALK